MLLQPRVPAPGRRFADAVGRAAGGVRLRRAGGASCRRAHGEGRPRRGALGGAAHRIRRVLRGCCVAPEEGGARARAGDPWDAVLDDVHARTFSVSGMAFMDAWTADLDRLRQCYLHVLAPDGRVVPFCAYNLTDAQGGGLPSGRQGATIGDPERAAQRAGAERITSGPHAPEEDARRPAGCMVCGADLVYRPVETPAVCHYCGRVGPSRAACKDGHFVCDACHRASAVEIIERVCLSSRATDAVALMQHIRAHPGFPLHGPRTPQPRAGRHPHRAEERRRGGHGRDHPGRHPTRRDGRRGRARIWAPAAPRSGWGSRCPC